MQLRRWGDVVALLLAQQQSERARIEEAAREREQAVWRKEREPVKVMDGVMIDAWSVQHPVSCQ